MVRSVAQLLKNHRIFCRPDGTVDSTSHLHGKHRFYWQREHGRAATLRQVRRRDVQVGNDQGADDEQVWWVEHEHHGCTDVDGQWNKEHDGGCKKGADVEPSTAGTVLGRVDIWHVLFQNLQRLRQEEMSTAVAQLPRAVSAQPHVLLRGK